MLIPNKGEYWLCIPRGTSKTYGIYKVLKFKEQHANVVLVYKEGNFTFGRKGICTLRNFQPEGGDNMTMRLLSLNIAERYNIDIYNEYTLDVS